MMLILISLRIRPKDQGILQLRGCRVKRQVQNYLDSWTISMLKEDSLVLEDRISKRNQFRQREMIITIRWSRLWINI